MCRFSHVYWFLILPRLATQGSEVVTSYERIDIQLLCIVGAQRHGEAWRNAFLWPPFIVLLGRPVIHFYWLSKVAALCAGLTLSRAISKVPSSSGLFRPLWMLVFPGCIVDIGVFCFHPDCSGGTVLRSKNTCTFAIHPLTDFLFPSFFFPGYFFLDKMLPRGVGTHVIL